MHHAAVLGVALALLSSASAFVLPAGQTDGIYKVHRTRSGEEIHNLVRRADPSKADVSSVVAGPLAKRDTWGQVYCGCGYGLDPGDTDAAVADLKGQLAGGPNGASVIAPGMSWYSIRGNTVAFVCNGDHNAKLKAWPDIVGQGLADVTAACGLYVSGSTGANYDFSIGYMQNNGGVDFCGNALTSPAGSC